jgi:flagella basal body P-ring formation protein FlgA
MPAAIVLLLASVAPACAAEAALRASLAERYPSVTRWQIKAFTEDMPAATEAKVVLLGPRSAVRVGRRVYWYSVAGFSQVVSTLHGLAPGQALEPRDGQLSESNIVAANCEPVTDPTALSGKRTRKALRANEVVCVSAIEPRPLVARGEQITVRYVSSNVVLTINGVAQNDGAAGDSLLVLNPRSHDLFRAVVSGAREVTIHE